MAGPGTKGDGRSKPEWGKPQPARKAPARKAAPAAKVDGGDVVHPSSSVGARPC